jgi:hypothetical protein
MPSVPSLALPGLFAGPHGLREYSLPALSSPDTRKIPVVLLRIRSWQENSIEMHATGLIQGHNRVSPTAMSTTVRF